MADVKSPDVAEGSSEQLEPKLGKGVELSKERRDEVFSVLNTLGRWKREHAEDLIVEERPGFTRYRDTVYSATIDGQRKTVEVYPHETGMGIRDSQGRFVVLDTSPQLPTSNIRELEVQEQTPDDLNIRKIMVGVFDTERWGMDTCLGTRILTDPLEIAKDGLRILQEPSAQLESSRERPIVNPIES